MITTLLLLSLAQAPPVPLHEPSRLSLLPRDELLQHFHQVEDEVRALRHEVTGLEVFGRATERATPFVIVTAVPLGVLGFIAAETKARFTPEVWMVAGGALAVGLFVAVFYAVGSVVEHFLILQPEQQARLRALLAYRPVVANALGWLQPAPKP